MEARDPEGDAHRSEATLKELSPALAGRPCSSFHLRLSDWNNSSFFLVLHPCIAVREGASPTAMDGLAGK